MRTVDPGSGFVFAGDAATAVAGAFNAAWLSAHWLRIEQRGRRLAALTLAVLSAGIAMQAAFAQALFSAHRFGAPIDAFFAPAPWLAARALLLAGTLMLSMLILRRAS